MKFSLNPIPWVVNSVVGFLSKYSIQQEEIVGLDITPKSLRLIQLSKKGNDKHNPGEPLHWAKEKSTDHKDCIVRHLIDAGTIDPDSKMLHDVGLAWRALANLETVLEKSNNTN